jgi:hypothetical protein
MSLTQTSQDIFSRQSPSPAVGQSLRSVRQDNPALPLARFASRQPAPDKKRTRATTSQVETKPSRSQKPLNHQSRSEKMTFWVKPLVKAEIQRIAEQEGLSISATGAAFLEEAVRQKLHIQHAVLLQPIIEQTIQKEMRSFGNRLAFLLVRSCFTSEQTRSIVTNILGRQSGITPAILNTILDNSSKTAKRNMTRKTPQIETILAALEQVFMEETDGI